MKTKMHFRQRGYHKEIYFPTLHSKNIKHDALYKILKKNTKWCKLLEKHRKFNTRRICFMDIARGKRTHSKFTSKYVL